MRLAYLCCPAQRPCTRITYWGLQIFENRLYHSFTCPSETKEGNYEILLDAVTLETDCSCEWHSLRRRTNSGIREYGPIDMLRPQHLCHHLNAVSRWVKRKKKQLKETRATALEANRLLAERAKENAA